MSRYLLLLETEEHDLSLDELTDALRARLSPESCYDGDGNPIHGHLIQTAEITDAVDIFIHALTITGDMDDGEAVACGQNPKDVETIWVASQRFGSAVYR